MTDYQGPAEQVISHVANSIKGWESGRFPETRARIALEPDNPTGPYVRQKLCVLDWVWGSAHDGTWFVMPWLNERNDADGDIAFFSTAFEAETYAQLMSSGYVDSEAIRVLMRMRNEKARKRFSEMWE